MASISLKNAALILFFLTACAHGQKTLEERKFIRAKYLLSSVAPNDFLEDCGIDLTMDAPETHVIDPYEHGEFNPNTNIVFYPEGRYSVLTHEYTHALLKNAREECKDEILAEYAQWLDRLIDQNKRLRLQGR